MPRKIKEERVAYTVEPVMAVEADVSEVKYRSVVESFGWAKVSHFLTLDNDISDGAFRTYVLLLKYAQQKEKLWAGVENLASTRNVSIRTLSNHLAELEDHGLIKRYRRIGHSSLTYIEPLEPIYGSPT